jgi:hypothetical protein
MASDKLTDLLEICSLEVLMQALSDHSEAHAAEVGQVAAMIRRYLESGGKNQMDMAAEIFMELDGETRHAIRQRSEEIARHTGNRFRTVAKDNSTKKVPGRGVRKSMFFD